MKLNWAALSCESVPWALHIPLCNLHGCSPVGPAPSQVSSVSVIDLVQGQPHADVDERYGNSKEELENNREDGELREIPSVALVSSATSDVTTLALSKEPNLEHSRQMALLSKSLVSPIGKVKSQSYKRHDDDDFILMLGVESDPDEPACDEPEEEHTMPSHCFEADKKWVNYGAKDFSLVLTRITGVDNKTMKLEAKVYRVT